MNTLSNTNTSNTPPHAPPPPDAHDAKLAIVAAVNKPEVLSANLAKSPMVIDGEAALLVETGHPRPGLAYNAGLDRSGDADVIIFAHQDVYLPPAFESQLRAAMAFLNEHDPNWAVLGPTGRTVGGDEHLGRVWSRGIYREIGRELNQPIEATALDEMVLVLRRNSGLRFDPELPTYHLYAADLILNARKHGYGSYIFHGPAVHNSEPVVRLDDTYARGYRYMATKWRTSLPIPTCVVPVTRVGWPLWKLRIRKRLYQLRNKDIEREVHDGPTWSKRLGYE